MTSYSHQAVGEFMADIMDNVIQRYMYDLGWYGHWDDGFRGNGWDLILPGKSHGSYGGKVQMEVDSQSYGGVAEPPPGATYLGEEIKFGRYFYKYEVDPYEIYKPWVDRVNEAFRGWRSLPDPADFVGPINHLEQAVDELTPDEQSDGEYTFVNAEVANALNLVHKWISPQGNNSSDLLYAFDAAYGDGRISAVMINQAQVAAGLGFTVAGEKELWTKARADIMAIGVGAAKALDVTQGSGFHIDLGVVKAFVDLAAVFVPAQYKVLTSAASAGLNLLDKVLPKPTKEAKELTLEGWTADEMMTSLEGMVKELELSIRDEELELINRLDELRGFLGSRAASDFHIHPHAGIDQSFVDEAEIRFNSTAVQRVGTENIPTIAAAYLRAADQASAETGEGIWTRDNMIGWTSVGPYRQWINGIEEFDKITTGTAKELVEAGKVLAVAAGWIENADVEAGLASQGLKDELDRGEDHWSHA